MSESLVPHSSSAYAPALFRRSLGDALELAHGVDAVAVEERSASLAKRSLKKEAKVWGLKLAISMIDLTTLEGKDTPGKVRALCQKAMRPDPSEPTIPHVGAVCVYPTMVSFVAKALKGSGVKTAAVATGVPSGQTFKEIKVQETRQTVAAGADEIDMVIDRGAFLSGNYQKVFDEVAEVKEACGPAHLKVILEVGELADYDQIRKASLISMYAGADFIKTSTGKVTTNATLTNTLVMLEAIRDFYHATGVKVGMKPAGGIANAKLALSYLVVLYETLGPDWMNPDMFRLGASSLLNDILMQLKKETTGAYQSGDYFTID
ncbi:MAG TPA: deoxyribose-phosphate aldolase [Thermoanaerobaculia bacterium]|nr:deoxyribose-phosphate aldolase [Thermoanaerobaculia bacterium]